MFYSLNSNTSALINCKLICTIILSFFINVTFAQCVPSFGSVSNFALYTVAGAVGNTGTSVITGDIGANTGAITGFVTPTVVNGTVHNTDTTTFNAISDLIAAYNQLNNFAVTNNSHTPAYGLNETLTSGVYSIGGAGSLGGNLNLDAQGNSNAIFIFKFGGAFSTGAASSVTLINGANPANIFWLAEGAISMAAGTLMYGTLIANNGAISMGSMGHVYGRMYSTGGAVSVYNTTVSNIGFNTSSVAGGIVLSDQAICIGTVPADLVLSGNTAQVLKWQKSTDATFSNPTDIVSNLNVLSGSSIGILNLTTYFRAVVQNNGCVSNTTYSSTCTITIASTTWNGITWSNGLPTNSKTVIITGNFTTISDFSACTLQVSNGANFNVLSGNTVYLNGALTIDSGSSFTVKNNANLIQSSAAQNFGTIQVEKSTSALNLLDYVLWSTPVANQLLQAFSPSTLVNRFYFYNPITNLYNTVASPSTTSFSAGTSCLIRLPNNHPTTPTVWNGTFSGIPNNGNINLSVTNTTYNAIGNPYPSGIDATMFMSENNITEAMYFWRKTNNTNTSSYGAFTLAGGVSNSGGDPLNLVPGIIIPVGQGFIVKATSNLIKFNNSMRVAAINAPLLKTANDKSRIWLNITSANGFFGQQMIAYMDGATVGIDNSIDGRFYNDVQTAFTSIIDNLEFSIQGRPVPFDASDEVSLGFKTNVASTFTISLNNFDGLFSEGQDIYLKDTTNGLVTNLKLGNYTFTTLTGVFNSRFKLLYQNQLSNPQQSIDPNQVIIYNQNSNVTVNSGTIIMSKIKIFDIAGKVLIEKENINSSEYKIALNTKNMVYIVQIISNDNEVITKKILN